MIFEVATYYLLGEEKGLEVFCDVDGRQGGEMWGHYAKNHEAPVHKKVRRSTIYHLRAHRFDFQIHILKAKMELNMEVTTAQNDTLN